MRKIIFFVIALLLVLAGISAGVLYWLTQPVDVPEPRFVEIERGTSTRTIAAVLAGQGIIRAPWAFLAVRALRPGAKLQAGEYEFSGSASAWQVFDKIRSGQIYYQEVTVPEGSNLFDIAAILSRTGTIKPAGFLLAARDSRLIRDLDPTVPSLEGYLFPSTYRITHKTSAHDLCRMMTQEFRREWRALGGGSASLHQVVTLASLVEKETALPSERPLVAAVFNNRLRLGMPLQCDPTTVYAALMENRYRGVIHKSDLASTNAYNTYSHAGLPPGPIANPGLQSLKAALNPAKADVLYFVARVDGSGSHHFSKTLTEHLAAVVNYRKSQHQ